MAAKSVKHVVVDSGGFIRNAPISEIGEKIYSIAEVVNEIRDKATRQRLQVLPYQITFRQPSPEAIRCVTDFAKKTGDYKSLSAVDLRVLALVYMLEKEHVGAEHIRTQPNRKIEWTTTTKNLEKNTDIAGFYVGKKKSSGPSRTVSESQPSEQGDIHDDVEKADIGATENEINSQSFKEPPSTNEQIISSVTHGDEGEGMSQQSDEQRNQNITDDEKSEKENSPDVCNMQVSDGDCLPEDLLGEEEEESSSEDEEEDEDDEGWITPGNIKQMKEQMGDRNVERAEVEVGCITTDFSMQNVLIQMGLNVISVDGMLIKRAKSYVLRCSACMKITTDMMKEFCPNCGNKTLHRVSMSVDEDGAIHYYLSRRKAVTTRGLKYSLPAPKGGRYARNPILVADQREAQQRTSRAGKKKLDVFDPDYVANDSPFAINDITSRSALLGIRDFKKHSFQKRRNPNENKKRTGKRK